MGGYSSFPICIAAYILKIKFIIYENNLIIGKANKILLPFAKKILVSYKDLEGVPKKYNDKIVQVGNIVREEIINSNIVKENTNNFGVIKILVLGIRLHRYLANYSPKYLKSSKNNLSIKIYQQCQKRQNEYLSNFYKNKGIDYEVFNFTDKIMNYYNKANLVITRAGASVLGELINVNIPFISIPLPTSKDNHQLKNAQFYEKRLWVFNGGKRYKR